MCHHQAHRFPDFRFLPSLPHRYWNCFGIPNHGQKHKWGVNFTCWAYVPYYSLELLVCKTEYVKRSNMKEKRCEKQNDIFVVDLSAPPPVQGQRPRVSLWCLNLVLCPLCLLRDEGTKIGLPERPTAPFQTYCLPAFSPFDRYVLSTHYSWNWIICPQYKYEHAMALAP